MPSEKAMLTEAVALETAYDAKEGLAEDIVKFALAHTAEALADYKRVLGECERVLWLATLLPNPSQMDVKQVKANAVDALAALAEAGLQEKVG